MTNLSILLRLRALETPQGLLTYFVPRTTDRTEGRRHIWLTKAAQAFCFPLKDPPYKTLEGLANLEARMNEFVRGAQLIPDVQLKCLAAFSDPDQYWEIRTPTADTQVRLFGWFPAPKCYLATHGMMRADVRDWDKQKTKVLRVRRQLGLPAFQGYQFNDYVR